MNEKIVRSRVKSVRWVMKEEGQSLKVRGLIAKEAVIHNEFIRSLFVAMARIRGESVVREEQWLVG